MRRVTALVVLASLVAAACGGSGAVTSTTTTTTATVATYPAAIVANYLAGCLEEGDAEFCTCTIQEFQQRLDLASFLALDGDDIDLGGPAGEVIRICLGDAAPTTTIPAGPIAIATLVDLIEITIADLEVFWAVAMPRVWGLAYESPTFAAGYHIGRGDVPECGGPLDRAQYEFNAFYCHVDDSIQWDMDLLMASLYEDYGDFTVALVLAHEWGHAVQARFGFDDFTHPTIVSELQADCFAGAWTGWVDGGESDLLVLEPGDLEEAMAGFLLIGDELGTAPTGHDAHGTAFERLNAFFEGYNGGPEQCATYEDEYPLIITWALEQDTLDLPYEIAAPILVDALEVFWSIVYPDVFGEPWQPVSAVIPYYPSSGVLPPCGDFPLDAEFYEFNIFYCPVEDYVAWDDEQLFPGLYAEIGDFALGLLLALQWGRAVQNRAGLPMEGPFSELQADCFAGSWTASLTFEDNPMELYLSAGDLEEGISSFLLFADHESEEVSAFRRFEAFKAGFLDGMVECF
jgi:predicted metalloprotease